MAQRVKSGRCNGQSQARREEGQARRTNRVRLSAVKRVQPTPAQRDEGNPVHIDGEARRDDESTVRRDEGNWAQSDESSQSVGQRVMNDEGVQRQRMGSSTQEELQAQ